jgi:predicted hydrocarbon binding protein
MEFKKKLPNQMIRLALITAEEILGKGGLNSVLNFTKLQKFIDNYPPDDLGSDYESEDFTKLVSGLINIIGEKGARSLLFRGGLRGFEISYEHFKPLFHIDGVEPERKSPDKMFDEFKRIYQFIIDASVAMYGDIYKFYDCEEGATLEVSPCIWCVGIKTENPICFAQLGYMHGVTRWIFGEPVKIEETECIACGADKCKFVIHRPG